MSNNRLSALAAIVVVVALVVAAAALVRPTTISLTENGGGSNPNLPTITGTGTGLVHVTPDIATVSLGVSVTKPTVKDVQSAAATAMSAVMASLTQNGVAQADITTTDLSLQPQYDQVTVPCLGMATPATAPDVNSGSSGSAPVATSPAAGSGTDNSAPTVMPIYPCQSGQTQRLSGYTMTNMVTVTVRKLDQLAAIVDGAMSSGTTNLNAINFSLSDPDAATAQARDKALVAAKAEAADIASATGVSLGAIQSVNIGSINPPQPLTFDKAYASAGSAVSTPVSAGTLDVSVTASIVYAIK